jgi:hypothetical protein
VDIPHRLPTQILTNGQERPLQAGAGVVLSALGRAGLRCGLAPSSQSEKSHVALVMHVRSDGSKNCCATGDIKLELRDLDSKFCRGIDLTKWRKIGFQIFMSLNTNFCFDDTVMD